MARIHTTKNPIGIYNANKLTSEVFTNVTEHTRRRMTGKKMGSHALGEAMGTLSAENIAQTASNISEHLASTEPNHPHRNNIDLIAVLPSTLDALPRVRNSKEARKTIISYNNTLKDIINRNPKITPDELLNMVHATSLQYNRTGQELKNLIGETQVILQGMRHELAVESVLLNLPEGYTYKEGDTEDDGKGRDYIVTAPNGQKVYIDIKASDKAAARSIEERESFYNSIGKKPPRNHIISASGFNDQDFSQDSPWRPSFEATQSLVSKWKELIDDAASMQTVDSSVDVLQK